MDSQSEVFAFALLSGYRFNWVYTMVFATNSLGIQKQKTGMMDNYFSHQVKCEYFIPLKLPYNVH